MERLTLELAVHLLAAAEEQARQLGLPFSIAVVDAGGALIAFHRMDNAKLAGIDIARNKAWTSATMQMSTAALGRLAQPGGEAFGVNTTLQGKIVILGGGLPLVNRRRVVGAVGVSGGTGAQDVQVAEAAVQAFHRIVGPMEGPDVRFGPHAAFYGGRG